MGIICFFGYNNMKYLRLKPYLKLSILNLNNFILYTYLTTKQYLNRWGFEEFSKI